MLGRLFEYSNSPSSSGCDAPNLRFDDGFLHQRHRCKIGVCPATTVWEASSFDSDRERMNANANSVSNRVWGRPWG